MNQLFKLGELYDQNGDMSKRWYVGYYFLHPETKRFQFFRYKWISTKLSTKQARRNRAFILIQQINNKLRSGYNPYATENIGLTNIIQTLNEVLVIRAGKTGNRCITTDKSIIKKLTDWLILKGLDKISIDDFNIQHALKFGDYLKLDLKLQNRTHNNHIQVLRTIFNFLVKREYIYNNPFNKVEYLPAEEKRPRPYNDAELNLLIENCPIYDPQLWIICQFVFYCALRPVEITRLKINNINLDTGLIYIDGNMSKNKRCQTVHIHDKFLEQLKKLELNKYDSEYYLVSKDLLPGPVKIFPTRIAERFKKFSTRIGLQRGLYELKHTAIILLTMKNNSNIWDVKNHCRHSNINITEKYLEAFGSNTSKEFRKYYPEL